ncbi:MAG: anti-sigma factor, partial [Pseudonocardia sp.]|nr:anti-sigma factor [Pseudonocardia sp.]
LRPRPAEPVVSTQPESARRHRLDAEEPAPTRRRSFLGGRGRKLVAASVAAVAVASLGGLIVTNTQLEQQRNAETAQAQGLSELIAELDRPGSRHALLTDPETGATVAALLVNDTERQVYTVGLPANPGDQVYVAWGLKDGSDPVPLGVFDVAAADQGVRTVGSDPEADDFSGYAISIEPGRVAPASPTTVVANGQVAI